MEKIGADDYRASKLRNWLEKRNMQKSKNKATLEARLNGLPPEARGGCPPIGELEVIVLTMIWSTTTSVN